MKKYKLYPVSRYVLLENNDVVGLYEMTGPYVWDFTLIKKGQLKCNRIIRYYGKSYYRVEE